MTMEPVSFDADDTDDYDEFDQYIDQFTSTTTTSTSTSDLHSDVDHDRVGMEVGVGEEKQQQSDQDLDLDAFFASLASVVTSPTNNTTATTSNVLTGSTVGSTIGSHSTLFNTGMDSNVYSCNVDDVVTTTMTGINKDHNIAGSDRKDVVVEQDEDDQDEMDDIKSLLKTLEKTSTLEVNTNQQDNITGSSKSFISSSSSMDTLNIEEEKEQQTMIPPVPVPIVPLINIPQSIKSLRPRSRTGFISTANNVNPILTSMPSLPVPVGLPVGLPAIYESQVPVPVPGTHGGTFGIPSKPKLSSKGNMVLPPPKFPPPSYPLPPIPGSPTTPTTPGEDNMNLMGSFNNVNLNIRRTKSLNSNSSGGRYNYSNGGANTMRHAVVGLDWLVNVGKFGGNVGGGLMNVPDQDGLWRTST
ncbi:hypothetical protein HDU76_010443, partial [Blyttiomyces sp. JEL0837]